MLLVDFGTCLVCHGAGGRGGARVVGQGAPLAYDNECFISILLNHRKACKSYCYIYIELSSELYSVPMMSMLPSANSYAGISRFRGAGPRRIRPDVS